MNRQKMSNLGIFTSPLKKNAGQRNERTCGHIGSRGSIEVQVRCGFLTSAVRSDFINGIACVSTLSIFYLFEIPYNLCAKAGYNDRGKHAVVGLPRISATD